MTPAKKKIRRKKKYSTLTDVPIDPYVKLWVTLIVINVLVFAYGLFEGNGPAFILGIYFGVYVIGNCLWLLSLDDKGRSLFKKQDNKSSEVNNG